MVLVVAACTRVNTSTLPPYVRDLRPAVGGIEMIQCAVVVTTKRENTFWENNKTTREISMGQCWNQVVSTEPPAEEPPQPPPPPLPPISMGGAR